MSVSRSFDAGLLLVLSAALPIAGGCGDDGGSADPQVDASGDPLDAGSDVDAAFPTIEGDWVVTDGDLIPGVGSLGLQSIGLRFAANGTGSAVFRDRTGSVTECLSVFVARVGNALAIDFSASEVPIGRVFTIVTEEDDTMTLFDADGLFLFLSRPGGELPGFSCEAVDAIARFDGLPPPLTGTGAELEFDGTNLLYAASEAFGEVLVIDPDDGEQGTPLTVSPNGLLAEQAGDLWVVCNCGGNTDFNRVSGNATLDTVDTAMLGQSMNVRTMAIDSNTDNLLVVGTTQAPYTQRLLEIDAEAEPDVLVGTREFPVEPSLQSLAFDGSALWATTAVVRGVLVKLDPATGAIVETWQMPDPKVAWQHVAFGGGRMFALGVAVDTTGTIVEIAFPPGRSSDVR